MTDATALWCSLNETIAEQNKEIRKLRESIQKIKEEIKVIRDRECLEHDSFDEYSEGRYDVACECLRIIDKNLAEVNNADIG